MSSRARIASADVVRMVAMVAMVACIVALCACGAGRAVPAPSGQELFGRACGACHSLNGSDDPRLQGGDLLAFHAPAAEMTQLVVEMPVRRPLSPAGLRAVVRYVMAAESRGR